MILCVLLGAAIGLFNGILVTILKVPAFIATLTMLFIGRGFVLALTHGQAIYYSDKAKEHPLFFRLGETNAFGFNNQIAIFVVVAVIGAYVLAKTRWGYETFATGGNEQAAAYAGIPTRLGAHPRLPDLVALRDPRGPDVGRAGQGRDPALRRELGAHRSSHPSSSAAHRSSAVAAA